MPGPKWDSWKEALKHPKHQGQVKQHGRERLHNMVDLTAAWALLEGHNRKCMT